MKKINIQEMPKVSNLKTASGNNAVNQFKLELKDTVIFQSYDSIIVILDYKNETITLGKNWDYSSTTSRHLYQFLRKELGVGEINKQIVNKWIDNKKLELDFNSWTVEFNKDLR